jgi:hypothetical protein
MEAMLREVMRWAWTFRLWQGQEASVDSKMPRKEERHDALHSPCNGVAELANSVVNIFGLAAAVTGAFYPATTIATSARCSQR